MPDKQTKTRSRRAFKLQAIARMKDAPDIKALAAELGVQRMLLFRWRQNTVLAAKMRCTSSAGCRAYRARGEAGGSASGAAAHESQILTYPVH